MIFRRGQRIIIVFPFFFSFFYIKISPDFRGFSKEKKPFFVGERGRFVSGQRRIFRTSANLRQKVEVEGSALASS